MTLDLSTRAGLGRAITLIESRLRKQYTALDTKISSLTTLGNYVTQQIAQWNKSTS